MRASNILIALPALAAAQQQVPLFDQVKSWFAKASASISSALPTAPSSVNIPNPVASGAAKIAKLNVDRLTLDNHKHLLVPGAATASPGIEEWMIFVTGGNKTCFGLCGHAETAFNESVVLISTVSKDTPHLAMLNCETDGVLCNAWAAAPPEVLYMSLPQPRADQSLPPTAVRYIPLNRTSVTPTEIADLHIQQKYIETEPYVGFFHPFDGQLAQLGLSIPVGYVIWGFSQIPSWAFMIGISMLSRSFMSKRMGPQGGAPAQGGAAGAAPAAAR